MLIRSVSLLGTSGCHLCDTALNVVERFNDMMKVHEFVVQVENVDVAASKELFEQYGVRIPVLIDGVTARELNWPFDEKCLYEFLLECDRPN